MPTSTLMPPFDHESPSSASLDELFAACNERHELLEWEKDYSHHPRVRRCPLCEDAVYGNEELEIECEIHGDPYESPYEADIMFERLFGSLPPGTSSVKRRLIRQWQDDYPMPAPTWGPLAKKKNAKQIKSFLDPKND